ncbi:hypothetical protein RB595_003562 [Gaeumannomyces hyphopodioides]
MASLLEGCGAMEVAWMIATWLWRMSPGILLVPGYLMYLAATAWAIGYRFAWLTMVSPPELRKFFGPRDNEKKKWAGIAILVMLGCLHLYTLGTWATAIVRGNWPDRRRPRLDRVPRNKRIMQSSRRWKEEAGMLVGPWALAYLDESLGGLDRPRFCDRDHCPSPELRLGDRMYCTGAAFWISGHLPLYDHFCHWTFIPIWLDSIKAYLLLLASMVIDAAFCFCCCLVSFTLQGSRDAIPLGVCALASGFLVLYHGWNSLCLQWKYIGVNNSVATEYSKYRHSHHFALVKSTPRGKQLQYFNYDGNPWDLGSRTANLRAALGASFWEWPLFWRQPERVEKYGRGSSESDLPMSERFLAVVRHLQGEETTTTSPSVEPRRGGSFEHSSNRHREVAGGSGDIAGGFELQRVQHTQADIHPAFRRRQATDRSSADIADMV